MILLKKNIINVYHLRFIYLVFFINYYFKYNNLRFIILLLLKTNYKLV